MIRIHKVYLNIIDWIDESLEELIKSMKDRNIPLVKQKKEESKNSISKTNLIQSKKEVEILIEKAKQKIKIQKYDEAEKIYNDVFNMYRINQDSKGMGDTLIKIGQMFHSIGDISSSLRSTISGVRTYAFNDLKEEEFSNRLHLALLYSELGMSRKSVDEINKVKDYFSNNISIEKRAIINFIKGITNINSGNIDKAKELLLKNDTTLPEPMIIENDFLLSEILLIQNEYVNANKYIKKLKINDLFQHDSLRLKTIIEFYNTKKGKYNKQNIKALELQCDQYNGSHPLYIPWWYLCQSYLWSGQLYKAEKCQQNSQDYFNEWITNISDTNVQSIYKSNSYFYKQIFSFINLPKGIGSIEEDIIENEKEWCYDCGRSIKVNYNYCPTCGIIINQSA